MHCALYTEPLHQYDHDNAKQRESTYEQDACPAYKSHKPNKQAQALRYRLQAYRLFTSYSQLPVPLTVEASSETVVLKSLEHCQQLGQQNYPES